MLKKILLVKTKYGSFKCVFESEIDMGGYSVEARGVQGAVSWGKTLTEAKKMITEAIEGAIEANIIIKAEGEGRIRPELSISLRSLCVQLDTSLSHYSETHGFPTAPPAFLHGKTRVFPTPFQFDSN